MRLTLRTMLAYLDDVLEPADAQELAKKIEESEFATSLVQRMRSSMRRLRLGAPKLEGKSPGLDCNTVAEYLDNTLPPDQVPDFEKVCLESEVNLAEVAACHQILTLVLGEPAEVEPAVRERVYRLGTSAEGGSQVGTDQSAAPASSPPTSDGVGLAAAATTDSFADDDQTTPPARKRPEVPDYLKSDSRARLWPMALTAVLALLLVGAVVMALGPDTIKGWFTGGSDPEVADAGAQDKDASTTAAAVPKPVDGTATPGAGESAGGVAGPAVTDGSPLRQPGEFVPGPSTTGGGTDGAVAVDAVDSNVATGPDTSGTGPESVMPAEPPVPPFGAVDDTAGAVDDPAAAGDGGAPSGLAFKEPGIDDSGPGGTELAKADPLDVLGDDGAPDAAPPTVEASDVARFTSEEDILVRYNAETGDWFRVPRGPLQSGDRLLVFPTFRPQILLVNGVQLTLDGPTALQLAPTDEGGTPWLKIEYGKLLLVTAPKAGAQVGVEMGERRGVLTFGDTDSTAALEVRPFQDPGTDPESRPPRLKSDLYVTSGTIQWQQSDSAATMVPAGSMRTFVDTTWAETLEVEQLPEWIGERSISDIDQGASRDLRTELIKDDAPVSLRLLELADHRRLNVRSLAIRCGACLNQFEPFPAALNDPQQKSYWVKQIEALTEAVQRGPETAALIRQEFEKHRSADAKSLYRLLCGFSVKDLEDGWDAKLVGYLDHDSMDFRVLAIDNLRRISGGSTTHLYRAEHTETVRKAYVQRWRAVLNEGGVRYKTPPTPPPATAEPIGSVPDDGRPETVLP